MGDKDRTVQCPQCQSRITDDSRFCNRCGHYIVDKADTLTYTPPLEKILDDHLEFSPGDMFGPRYRIIEEIGRGGMGRVYKAKDQELDITVALKMIRSVYSSNPRFIQRFKEETLLSRSISHENVIRIHDLGDVDDVKFISMDYIKGHDLKELIHTSGTLSIQTALSITKQICKGLKAAHQKNIIHLDLKPRNIMLDSDGKAYIMDFGVARSLGIQQGVQEKKLIGTPAYVSPEQAKGEDVDTRSDVYSLGIILFEMLTGKRPFEADTLDDYVDMHIHKKPPLPSAINPHIPPFLDSIILKCLQKDKSKRYQNITEILDDFDAHEEESKFYQPQTNIKKERKLWYLVPVVLLAAAAIYIFVIQKKTAISLVPEGERIPLIVMYFENNTGDERQENWRKALPVLIIQDLLPSKFIRVLSADKLYSILESLDLQDKSSYSADDFKRVAQRGGANHLLYGYYTLAEDTYRIDVMFKNITTGELIDSKKIEGKGEFVFYDACNELTFWIKEKFNIAGNEIAADADSDIRDIFTSSPEALKLYIQGKQSYYLGDLQESNKILERAVEIDEGFALAYRQISENYHYLGEIDQAQKFAKIALSLKDKTSLRDRYFLEGWAQTILEESYKNAEKIYLEMLQNYPDDEDANIYLGAIYRNMEKWVLAKERFEKILAVNPHLSIENILLYYRAMGQFENARTFIEKYKNDLIEVSDFHFNKGIINFYQKDYDNSRLEFEESLATDPDFLEAKEMLGHLHFLQNDFEQAEYYYAFLIESESPTTRLYGQIGLVSLRLAQGRFFDCQNEIIQGIEEAEEENLDSNMLTYLNYLAYVKLRMGDLEEALKAAEKAEQIATELNFHFDKITAMRMQGAILIALEKIQEAKKITFRLKEYLDRIEIPKLWRFHYQLEGMIALHERRASDAVNNLKKAISLLSHQYESFNDHAFHYFSLALTHYKMNDLDQAQKQFAEVIELTSGRLHYGDLYAKSFYWLGKIFQREDQKPKAIEHFKKFLDLWKNADSGIPEIAEAKKELEALDSSRLD